MMPASYVGTKVLVLCVKTKYVYPWIVSSLLYSWAVFVELVSFV